MKKTTAILAATLSFIPGVTRAQTVPPFINYQGKVTDSAGVGLGTGTPVNRKVIFRIFDAPSGGKRLWSEQHTVTISNGEFSVLLGNGIDAVYNGVTETPAKSTTPLESVFTTAGILRYVEIVVDNGDGTLNNSDGAIAPRQQITSTAYSFRARSADTIASGTDLQLNNSANYGLGYYGTGRPFNGVAVDGPVLFGQAGGALGSVNSGTRNIALRWNAAGAVGIGSADLTGAAATTKLVLQGDDTNTVPLQLNIRGNTNTNKRLLIGYNTTSNYGSLQAYSAAATTTNLLLNPSGGNVGIGSADLTGAAATTKLVLQGDDTNTVPLQLNIRGNTDTNKRLLIGYNTTSNSGSLQAYSAAAATTNLLLNPSGGNVGIGTTAPIAALHIVKPTTGVGQEFAFVVNKNTTGDRALWLRTFGDALPYNLELFEGQAFKPGGGSWGAVSDRRLKKDILPLDGALSRLLKLKPSTFEFIDPRKHHQLEGSQIGFIAQEVEEVFPEWVTVNGDGYKTVSIRGFESLTVQALRELREEKDAEVKALREENVSLRERLAALEAKDKARDAKLSAIEKVLFSADQGTTRTVSLGNGRGQD